MFRLKRKISSYDNNNLCVFSRNKSLIGMNSVPYTERRNALTMNIDTNTSEGSWELTNDYWTCYFIGIVESLHKCNLEVFNGYENHKVNGCSR